jgi:hypothetical protein
MPTLDSTATLPELKTAPPANGKDLKTVVTYEPAPRLDGENLFIKIEVGSDEATFHCQDQEHVGTHSQRHVLFWTNKHCWLIFSNKSVFNRDYLELPEGVNVAAQISDQLRAAETGYNIRVTAKTAKTAKMMKAATAAKHGPVIVVP